MMMGPFFRIYTALIGYVLNITGQAQKSLNTGIAQELAFVQLTFFVGAIGLLLWHLFVQGEGESISTMVKNLITKNTKILMVGILVANGGFIASALAGVAIGQATDAVKLYAYLGQVAKTVDIQMDSAIENMQGYPMVAARVMDIHSGWITQEQITRYGAGQDGGEGVSQALGQAATRAQDLSTRAARLQSQADHATDRQVRGMYQAQATATQAEAQRVQSVVQSAQDIVSKAKDKLAAAAQGWTAKLDPTKNDGFLAQFRRLFYLLSGEAATDGLAKSGQQGMATVSQISRYTNPMTSGTGMIGKVIGFVDWITASPAYLVGYATGLLVLLGVVILGITVIKESFAVATYIAGFLITLNLAAAIAAPLAPIFFLGFLWEKTESYARSYVGFWFSAIFAAAGLSAMSSLVISLIQGLTATMSPEVAVANISIFGAHSASEMLGAGISSAASLVCMSMCFSFVLDLLKRGAAVGAGVWSGSFPT